MIRGELSLAEREARVADACRLMGGRLLRPGYCRAPAPGKGRQNDSLAIMENAASRYGLHAHLHNAPDDKALSHSLHDSWANQFGWKGQVGNATRPRRANSALRAHSEPRPGGDKSKRDRRACKRIWDATEPIQGEVLRYLLGTRGLCDLGLGDGLSGALRMHPALGYWALKGQRLFTSAAMVAMVTDCQTEKPLGLHLTWIDADGQKHPDANPARKMRGITKGGCVRLGAMARDGRRAVAEGIESALAFTALWGIPCDAGLSADGLKHYSPPKGVTALAIAHDMDGNSVGQNAAIDLQARMSALTIPTKLTPAPIRNGDWNDYLLGR